MRATYLGSQGSSLMHSFRPLVILELMMDINLMQRCEYVCEFMKNKMAELKFDSEV